MAFASGEIVVLIMVRSGEMVEFSAKCTHELTAARCDFVMMDVLWGMLLAQTWPR